MPTNGPLEEVELAVLSFLEAPFPNGILLSVGAIAVPATHKKFVAEVIVTLCESNMIAFSSDHIKMIVASSTTWKQNARNTGRPWRDMLFNWLNLSGGNAVATILYPGLARRAVLL